MKVSLKKSELAKALSLTQSVVERKTTMPILSNLLLSANGGEFKISATDLEITAVVRAEATIDTEGSTTVSSKVLGDIVRELPEGEVTITLEDGERLYVKAGTADFKMLAVSADEYPSLPGVGLEPRAKVEPKEFLEMINRTIYAVSQDETRFNLNGVCFELDEDNGGLRMVATDGHRLALIERQVGGLDFKGSAIVPTKGLSELRKVLSNSDSQVGIDILDGFFLFESDTVKLATRLIDGEFPDYNQVIPKEDGTIAKLVSNDLAQALRRTALMVTDKGKCVRFDFASDNLTLSSSSPELGEARDDMNIDYDGGDTLSVGFNAKYILDILSSMGDSQEVSIELHGELGAGKITASGDASSLGIVMPMRLN